VSIVVNNQHLSHNYTCSNSSELITFPICKNCICFISLTSSMYMILYLQWQFNQCSTSKTKSLDLWTCTFNTPHSSHYYSSRKLGIRHQGVFLQGQNRHACPQSSNYQKHIYKLQILCILINIPSTMPQNAPTLLKCPATIKMFLLTQIQICQSLSAQYLQQHHEPIFTQFNMCISQFHISHFCLWLTKFPTYSKTYNYKVI